ncbi:MAG: triose-phosphate isomerase [Proteobacteria bacterium]|nr:triose-phosphate isomerase [Pseudomonadota bacterium]
MSKKLVVANWKMNGDIKLVKEYSQLFNENIFSHDVVVCPPFVYLWSAIGINGYHVGAQDCHFAKNGAYTGAISPKMLKNLGVKYVILGHSERRENFAETDILVGRKAISAQEEGLIPIICIGESLAERENGEVFEVLKNQLTFSIPKGDYPVIIAYEPVWAIGSGKIPTPSDIIQVLTFIKEIVPHAKVLYGGSVKASNAKMLLELDCLDGILIGGASLEVKELKNILTEF